MSEDSDTPEYSDSEFASELVSELVSDEWLPSDEEEYNEVIENVNRLYPDEELDIQGIVTRSLRNALQEEEVEEAYSIEELGREDVGEYEPVLKKLKLQVEKNQPTLLKILKAQVPKKSKIKAFKLYNAYLSSEPETEYSYDLEDQINALINKTYTEEQIKRIETRETYFKELIKNSGQDYDLIESVDDMRDKIQTLDADDSVKIRIYKMTLELENLDKDTSEYTTLRSKILWALRLPHNKTSSALPSSPEEIGEICEKVREGLDKRLYGLEKVKERALTLVHTRLFNPNSKSILALEGQPGLGKTRFAKVIAEALGLKFHIISLGGNIDSSMFKGMDTVWAGSRPSIILRILSQMGVSDGLILFDEIDKLGMTEKGKEVQNALLHITDYVQNKEFQDAFLSEFSHDISRVRFMCAMNDSSHLDSALRDRLDILKVRKYTFKEKKEIIKRFMLPEAVSQAGLKDADINITEQACTLLIHMTSKDPGLRGVEKYLYEIVSKLSLYNTYHLMNKTSCLSFRVKDFNGLNPFSIRTVDIKELCEEDRSIDNINTMYG